MPSRSGGFVVNDQLVALYGQRGEQLDFVIYLPAKLQRDFSEDKSFSRSDLSGNEVEEERIRCSDGFAINYTCSTATGIMAINQVDYQLSKGRVLVFRREGDKLVVKQLAIPIPPTRDREATIKKLAADQEEIKQFFSTAGAPQDVVPKAPSEPKKNP